MIQKHDSSGMLSGRSAAFKIIKGARIFTKICSYLMNFLLYSLTGRRYGDRRFVKWARFCRDSQLA